jgi:hypothetical protein
LAGAPALLASIFLLAAPAAAGEPSPTPRPTGHHVVHRSAGPTPAGPTPTGPTATSGPVHSGGPFAAGLPGIDGRVVALGSVLGLGLLAGVLGMRRD